MILIIGATGMFGSRVLKESAFTGVDTVVMHHFAAWKRGDADLVTDTYSELTGLTPISLIEWAAANRDAFTPSGR